MKHVAAVLGLLFLGPAFAPAARAGSSFEFLFSTSSVTNDSQFLLHLAVGDSRVPRTVIEPVLPRLHSIEDDLPVVLFLARTSGRSIEFIVDLRRQSLGWAVIFERVGVSCDTLFEGFERDPGPPYGKAWGHWKKNPGKLALSDDDIVGLVRVQTAHRVTGLSALEIVHAQGQKKSVATVVAEKKGRPDHAGKAKSTRGGKSSKPGKSGKPGKGRPKGK